MHAVNGFADKQPGSRRSLLHARSIPFIRTEMVAAIPAPVIIEPSGNWIGIDGNWSGFLIDIGTPAQSFVILPATGINAIWVPLNEGCDNPPSSMSDCGASRGARASSGPEANGLTTNSSSTWDQLGLYELPLDQDLFGQKQYGLFGTDSLSIGGSHVPALQNQAIAGVSSVDLWTGSIGLGTSLTHISETNASSLLVSMKDAELIPSLSYGYTAGASYSEYNIAPE